MERITKILGVIAISAVIAVSFIGCSNDNNDNGNSDPVSCTCDPKAHLAIDEKCTCGGSDCECTEQTDSVGGIPIRKQAGVTVDQMNEAVETFSLLWGEFNSSIQTGVKSNITEIRVIATGSISGGKGDILYIPYNADKDEIGNYLGENGFFIAQLQQKGIRLAGGFNGLFLKT